MENKFKCPDMSKHRTKPLRSWGEDYFINFHMISGVTKRPVDIYCVIPFVLGNAVSIFAKAKNDSQ